MRQPRQSRDSVMYLTLFPLLQFINFASWRKVQNAFRPYRIRVSLQQSFSLCSLLVCSKTSGDLLGWTTRIFAMPRYVKMVLRRCLKNKLKKKIL